MPNAAANAFSSSSAAFAAEVFGVGIGAGCGIGAVAGCCLAAFAPGGVGVVDMLGVGLIDESWPARFPTPLAERLQDLIDNPE